MLLGVKIKLSDITVRVHILTIKRLYAIRRGAVKRRSYWLKENNEVALTEGPVGGAHKL